MLIRSASILSLALATCVVTIALGAVQCASSRKALLNDGRLGGTLNGHEVAVRTAFLTASDLGELVIGVGDIDYSCADTETHREPPPYLGFLIHLADINGTERLQHPSPPGHAGLYQMIHFRDFRAGWMQRRGNDPARPGDGTRPPDGSYAALLAHAGGTLPDAGGTGVNAPIGVSGSVILGSFPQRAGDLVPITLDVTVESGERLRGSFQAVTCKKVFEAISLPARPAAEPAALR